VTSLVFWTVLVAYALNGASVALSIVRPDLRIWPPPRSGRISWQFVWNGILSYSGLLGVLVLGIIDWNSGIFDHWAHFVVGGVLMAAGGSFALWAFTTLGARASQGLGGALVRRGPYRYTRNPQYVGTIPVLVGYAILCNSTLALVAAVVASGWFILLPFAEEPWLRAQLGAAYDAYAAQVPRFLPFP
jgi:protein-S-isoprenylcysteine O-methyltransferase Ste14